LGDSLAGLAVVVAAAQGLRVVLQITRKRTWKSAASSLQFALAWLLQRHPKLFVSEGRKRRKKAPRRSDMVSEDAAQHSEPGIRDRLSRGIKGIEKAIKGLPSPASETGEVDFSAGRNDPPDLRPMEMSDDTSTDTVSTGVTRVGE
jgi:hypothetical protein